MRLETICRMFQVEGEYIGSEVIKTGHINSTYKVIFLRNGEEKPYIVQMINKYVFKKPPEVMENISNVTEYIRAKIKETNETAKRNVLHFQSTKEGKYYLVDPHGDYWRCYRYIDDSITYDQIDDLEILVEAGRAFGEFQNQLSTFDAKSLNITIPHFHNTAYRYKTFKKVVKKDEFSRVEESIEYINDVLSLEEIACTMRRMQEEGKLPLRVTHNDTKINNVIFDTKTNKHLAVIDLDTVLPGLTGHDFGDAIRFGASTAKEDETDLRKVSLDLKKFEAFTKGFVSVVKDALTEEEINTLALGAITMTVEVAMRFLTDYIEGDVYFRTSYPGHNLDRCRCQLKLAHDMIDKRDKMEEIVRKYAK